jgi:hypothetical protein
LLADLFSSCASYLKYELSLEFAPKYTPLDVMVIVVVTNCPFVGLPWNLKLKWDRLTH